LANISPLVSPDIDKPPIASKLNNIFNFRQKFTYNLSDGTGATQFKYNDLFTCGKTGVYLDSCYNFCEGKVPPCKAPIPDASTACCGCMDWEGVPTDKYATCDPKSLNPAIVNWRTIVKPYLSWLIDACPDAYEYQFGDKHGTMQCSSKDVATDTGNNINYTITFCPSGKGLFDASPDVSSQVIINAPDVIDIAKNSVKYKWAIEVKPFNAAATAMSSKAELYLVSNNTKVKEVVCSLSVDNPNCNLSFSDLTANTKYLLKINAQATIDTKVINATMVTKNFTTLPNEPFVGQVSVAPPTLSQMNLKGLLAAGLRCPQNKKFPSLQLCNKTAKDYRCITIKAPDNNEIVGQWALNQALNCYDTNYYSNPRLNNLIATYNNGNGPLKFTFKPNQGWTCQQQGEQLSCSK